MRISDWSSDVCSSDLLDYAINRYVFEAERHYGILDRQLADRRYMLGDVYTIVDMATWGWARLVHFILGDDAMGQLPHLKRLVGAVGWGPPAGRAPPATARQPFKTEMEKAPQKDEQ